MDKSIELDILTFNMILRDALIMKYKETEEGRKYLKDCWRYEQTEPDMEAIKKINISSLEVK